MKTPLGRLADDVLGYRADGRPILPIAGGSTPVVEPAPAPGDTNPQTGKTYTEAELNAERERVRQEEKAKLYAQMQAKEKAEEEERKKREAFEAQIAELLEKDKAREKAEAEARQKAEEEAKRKAEEEMSAKDLIAKREEEWKRQLEDRDKTWEERIAQIQAEREQERALNEKERQFSELQNYIQRRVAEEQENIIPTLLANINGNTQDEVEASITRAKEQSAEIGQQAEQAFAARFQNRGVGTTAPPIGAPDMIPGQTQQFTPEQIQNMSMAEYAEWRRKAGIGGAANNRGMYG